MTKKITSILFAFIFSFIIAGVTHAQDRDGVYLSSHLGGSHNFDSTVHFNLVGRDNINKSAKWDGNSFSDSLYYMVRFDNLTNNEGWGIEWVHHKVYLDNTDDQILDFSISDGYNLLHFNKVWLSRDGFFKNFFFRLGAGFVFGNPDVTLSGRERFWNDGGIGGTYFSGISTSASMEHIAWEDDRHFVTAELRLTASYARIPVSKSRNEFADVPNIALHYTIGVGSKPLPEDHQEFQDWLQYFAVPGVVNLIAHL